jgi:hypothetical protein
MGLADIFLKGRIYKQLVDCEMDILEAYDLTLETIKSLGIPYTLKTPKSLRSYPEDQLPPNKWLHVTFEIRDESDSIAIHEAANYLGLCGITFDVGSGMFIRDWEIDWSFKVTGDTEKWRDDREIVEEITKCMTT